MASFTADAGGAGGWAGDGLPAEEPQATEDRNQRLDIGEKEDWTDPDEFNFVYANGQLHISDSHKHQDLADHAGIGPDHTGPMAVGRVHVQMGKATFEVHGNLSAQSLARALKEYCKSAGWRWGGMTDLHGEPIGTGSEFAPVKSYILDWDEELDELRIARLSHSGGVFGGVLGGATGGVSGGVSGVVHQEGNRAYVLGALSSASFAALQEFASDRGLTLYGDNDNVLKRVEDLEVDNNYSPEWNDAEDHFLEQDPPDERKPGGIYRCPECARIFHSWGSYMVHRRSEEAQGDAPIDQPTFPDLDMDATNPPHFDEMRQEPGIHTGSTTWWKPGVPGRGYAFDDGVMTWPEDEMTHEQRCRANGVKFDRANAFNISPEGEVWPHTGFESGFSDANTHRIFELATQADSRLTPLDPSRYRKAHFFARAREGSMGQERLALQGMPDPKDQLMAPVPFIFDIMNDAITVGHPGTRHSDIPGKFTPGGIVEGTYEPGGKVAIRSLTNMPYSVRHMLELWYYQHPHMEIRGVHLEDDEGKKTKLASEDDAMAHANEDDWEWQQGLCGTYACALQHVYPHLRFGTLYGSQDEDGYVGDGFHAFAHDDTHAYDSLGAHPLPYKGIHGDLPIQTLDENPKDYGLPEDEDANPATLQRAIEHVKRTQPLTRMYPYRSSRTAAQDIGGYIAALAAADPAVWRAYKALQAAGGEVFVVGGAVRDALLGKEPKDIDLMVTGLPAEEVRQTLARLPGRVDLTGKDFGVFRYREGGGEVEIALPRRERSTGAGHQDFNVQADPDMTPEEDLFRRDFTANAMAVNLRNGQLIDPFDGSSDIRNRKLRTLNTKSFADDPLRTIRALVAMSKHGLYPTEETKQQMTDNGAGLLHLPKERIQAELDKLMAGPHPGEAIRLAQDTGILQHFMPEVSRAYGHSQNNPHHELELFDHLVNVLDRIKERKPNDPDLALAALLHDIGKVDAHWTECRNCGGAFSGHVKPCPTCGSDDTSGHFYENRDAGVGADHETVGAQQAYDFMMRTKYPKDRAERVRDLIQHHMFPAFTTDRGARKFLNKTGPHADDLLDLRWADQGGKSEYPTDPSLSVDQHAELLARAREMKVPTDKSMLAINGSDLIAAGMQPGPQMGQVLNQLTDHVIDNPEFNTKPALLGLVKAWGLTP